MSDVDDTPTPDQPTSDQPKPVPPPSGPAGMVELLGGLRPRS